MAVGTHKGFVQIWDAAAGKKLSMLEGHTARVGGSPGSQRASVVPSTPWPPGARRQPHPALCPASRGTGLERGAAVIREPGPHDPAEGQPHPTPTV